MDEQRTEGIVKWFSSKLGYGFIDHEKYGDVFANYRFIEMEGYKTLKKGQKVSYKLALTDRGPQAHEIKPL